MKRRPMTIAEMADAWDREIADIDWRISVLTRDRKEAVRRAVYYRQQSETAAS